MSLKTWHWVAALSAVALTAAGLLIQSWLSKPLERVIYTVGDVRAVHADVKVSSIDVHGWQRLSEGDTVGTGQDGRARIRLDDGTIIAVDGSTSLKLRAREIELASGRVFVQAGQAASTKVTVGHASTSVTASSAAFDLTGGKPKVYCAQGELLLVSSGRQTRVASGETATLDGDDVSVMPEKAFADWTGGLAVPWVSALGDKSGVALVRALSDPSDPGTPMAIRSQKVKVTVQGEFALTKTQTTYFNGASSATHARLRLALPGGAILQRVARRRGSSPLQEASVGIAAGPARDNVGEWEGLQWAGGGWLSGDLGAVSAGETLELQLDYAQWLPTRSGRATYRFPMAGGDDPALIGELVMQLDAQLARSAFISASAGSTVENSTVRYRRADVRPNGDLVVELAPDIVRQSVARAYVVQAEPGGDDYVMVRTEVPIRNEPGVTLALVVDTSMSIGAALETERAVIDAVLDGLGPRDSLVVLAADQTVRSVGPAMPSAVTPTMRAQVREALGRLRPAGASNLGVALQQACDLLDSPARGKRAGSGMVVYLGDGRPTVGEPDAEQIRRLIGRRAGGIPRLGAIAVGPNADRWQLAKLVAGVGSVYEVRDSAEAARAGATLLADALEPTLRDVSLDLGPTIDRIYPREARAVLAGSTVTVVGRLRGKLPATVGFRFRDGGEVMQESRRVQRVPLPAAQDVPKRWAEARIEEMAARDEGIEPAIALAADAHLLTPWTSWFFIAPSGSRNSSPFAERVLELNSNDDTPFAARVDPIRLAGSTLLETPKRFGGGVSLREAAEAATIRILRQARAAVRACRDVRAAARPDVGRSFSIDLTVDGGGRASRVRVVLADVRGGDPVLERCVRGVVQSLPYFAAGIPVNISHLLTVPEGRSSRRTQCSGASKVSLPIRKSLWRARGTLNASGYVAAAMNCELPRWSDRRAFLLLAWEDIEDGSAALQMAEELDEAGQSDAAAFVKSEALRRIKTFAELEQLSRKLQSGEPHIDGELEKAYKKARSDEERLAVVRRFLLLAPHSGLARRRLLGLLEALGEKEALASVIATFRTESFADAGLLALGASALRRLGDEAEGRRAFGELIERAPSDPWTLAYVGDRLRGEGMFDEAVAAYDSLERAMPNDAGVALRMALAHAGAGRIDIATRLLERVAQTGGRGDDGRLGELAAITQAVLLAKARGGKDAEVEAELERRLLQTPLPDVRALVMVQSPPADGPVEVSVLRERGEKVEQSADLDARTIGISAVRIERGDGVTRIVLKRPREAGLSMSSKVLVAALVLDRADKVPHLITRELQLSADGTPVELRFDGEALL